jgi:salicylate hydroxylase
LSQLSVGIVGAGPGGFAAALACHHAGLQDITIYERAAALEPRGAGIQLSPNASRVLIALGLRAAVERAASLPQAVHFRASRSGYLIAMRPLGRFSADRYGAPYWHVHRADLMEILARRAADLGIAVRTEHALTTLEQDDHGVDLQFASGVTTWSLAQMESTLAFATCSLATQRPDSPVTSPGAVWCRVRACRKSCWNRWSRSGWAPARTS